jgi:FMN phosphatase YigB (HAD superfamily)
MNISLFKLFNPNYIFTSDIIGHVKEDPEYFKYVQTKLQNENLTSCIYIDNNEFNIKSAKKLNATIFENIVLLLDSNELVDCILCECNAYNY